MDSTEQAPRDRAPEKRQDLEWRLPASEARKQAISTAMDHRAPEPSERSKSTDSYFSTEDGARVRLIRYPEDEMKTIEFGSGVARSVDRDRDVGESLRSHTRYWLLPTEDETLLHKDYWPGKSDDEDDIEVSEGEANWLLNEIANLKEPSATDWTAGSWHRLKDRPNWPRS